MIMILNWFYQEECRAIYKSESDSILTTKRVCGKKKDRGFKMIHIVVERKRRRKKSIQLITAYATGIAVLIWDAIVLALLF